MGKLGENLRVDFLRNEYVQEKKLWESMQADLKKAQKDLIVCAEDSNWEEIEEMKKGVTFQTAGVNRQYNRVERARAKLIQAEKHLKK